VLVTHGETPADAMAERRLGLAADSTEEVVAA
jgi:hypothetical protein